MSSPQLNNLIVIGCVLCYCCVFLFGVERFLEPPQTSIHSYLCNLRLWLLPIGFTLAFGTMFAKTWRVYRIFTNTTLHKNLKYLHDKHLMIIVGILLLTDVMYLSLWQRLSPMASTENVINRHYTRSDDTKTIYSGFKCQCQHKETWTACLYCYKGLLLVFGLFLAWETRNVQFEALNDSKYIGMSVYNVVIWTGVSIPLEFTVARDDPDASFGLVASAINICTTCTLIFLFLPKIRNLTSVFAASPAGPVTTEQSDTTKAKVTQHPCCPSCKCK